MNPYPWYVTPSQYQRYDVYLAACQRDRDGQGHSAEQLVELFGAKTPQGFEPGAMLSLLRENPAFLAHEWLHIVDKESGNRILFNAWTPAQKKLYVAVMRQRARREPVRAVILKARQMGISTLCEALLFWRTAWFPNCTSLIAAHEEDAVRNIFNMFRLYHEAMPPHMQQAVEKFNQGEIVFDQPNKKLRDEQPGMRSRLVLKTVALGGTSKTNTGKGRSATYKGVHASEAGYWAEPEKFWGGVEQAVPHSDGTFILVESTANGYGNWFHDFWRRAAAGWAMTPDNGVMRWRCMDKKASRSAYVPVFLSWLEHPQYRLPVAGGEADQAYYHAHLDPAERKLVQHFGADLEQIEWRRRVLADKCNDDLQLFQQEYPTTPEEAFISTGRKVFDMGALSRAEDRMLSAPAPRRADIYPEGDSYGLQMAADGPLYLYRDPVPGAAYSIGADTCYGKPDGDYACAQVLRNDTWEQVAVYHDRVEPDQLAHAVLALARMYNDAMVVVEIDGPGIHTDKKLGELDYWNRYRTVNPSSVRAKRQDSWGWRMTQKARNNMIQALKAAVRDEELVLNDLGTLAEMREWVLRTNVQSGRAKEQPADPTHGYDDRITAIGIALQGGINENGLGGVVWLDEPDEPDETIYDVVFGGTSAEAPRDAIGAY